jgi:hypothetical protein
MRKWLLTYDRRTGEVEITAQKQSPKAIAQGLTFASSWHTFAANLVRRLFHA